jgi:hypothetical protein
MLPYAADSTLTAQLIANGHQVLVHQHILHGWRAHRVPGDLIKHEAGRSYQPGILRREK